MILTSVERHRLAQKRYRDTEKGKVNIKRLHAKHRKTDKWKRSSKKAQANWEKSEMGRAWRARQRVRDRDKIHARNVVNHAIEHGRLIRGHCQDCGAFSNVDGHHEDYRQPLVVIWLCRSCHKVRHHGSWTEDQNQREGIHQQGEKVG